MFLSTHEKQLDAKRRIVVPVDFRAAATGDFEGIVCFPSFEADCIEGGGVQMLDRYVQMMNEFAVGDDIRNAIEDTVFGSQWRLYYDTAGRITLPEAACEMFGLTDWVCLVGLNDRFQIWPKDAYLARRPDQRALARKGIRALRQRQRGGDA